MAAAATSSSARSGWSPPLTGCQRMPAPALAERVEQVTCDWLAHGDHDDIAVLALRATGPGGRGSRHLHSVPAQAGADRQRETDA